MNKPPRSLRIALVTRGDRAAREIADGSTSRFADLYAALIAAGHTVELVIYDEDFSGDVREQLLTFDVVQVWVNPVDTGRDRADLDLLLREIADTGVRVSAHPDVVHVLGTKKVLYDVRNLGLGSDTRLYRSSDELRAGLAETLLTGPRAIKRQRGSSGDGVWGVRLEDAGTEPPVANSRLRVRHAKRGSEDELVAFAEYCDRMERHFENGSMLDQDFQARLDEGMIRCYLVRDRVAGFGFQATNALVPSAPGDRPPTPTQRNYFPETKPDFQRLKHRLETEWVQQMQELFDLDTKQLPLLWDCDFLLGPLDSAGADTYVLCEINVSSVAPYPESAVGYMVEAIAQW